MTTRRIFCLPLKAIKHPESYPREKTRLCTCNPMHNACHFPLLSCCEYDCFAVADIPLLSWQYRPRACFCAQLAASKGKQHDGK